MQMQTACFSLPESDQKDEKKYALATVMRCLSDVFRKVQE